MALSLGLYFTRGLNYGVDFKGGSLIEVQHKSGPADLGDMREKLNALGSATCRSRASAPTPTC